MKNNPKKTRTKLYLKIIGIIAAIVTALTIIGAWISYPTSEHRDVAHQTDQVINKNGGTYNFKAYESKEYLDLSNTDEALYSSRSSVFVSIGQFIILIAVVGQVYKYLRRNNVSPTKRTVGLTATLFTLAGIISSLFTPFPLAFFTGTQFVFDSAYLIAMLISAVITFVIYFIIASLFEIVYNRKNTFIVE